MSRFVTRIALLLTLVFFTASAFAAAGQEKVNISHPVTVGSVELKPGEYNMSWSGDSGAVQITFMQNKKVIASSSARMDMQANKNEQVETTSRNGVVLLQIVKTKNATFHLDVPPAPAQ